MSKKTIRISPEAWDKLKAWGAMRRPALNPSQTAEAIIWAQKEGVKKKKKQGE